VILLDTSGLLANYDKSDRYHTAAARVLAHPQRRILSPFVLAELAYLVAQTSGQAAELVVLEDAARGAYQFESFGAAEVAAARRIIEQYADVRLGLADASIAVLAERHSCHEVSNPGPTPFRAIVGPGGTPFRLRPLDSA
jgi:predicted nucleic acid-binding protein